MKLRKAWQTFFIYTLLVIGLLFTTLLIVFYNSSVQQEIVNRESIVEFVEQQKSYQIINTVNNIFTEIFLQQQVAETAAMSVLANTVFLLQMVDAQIFTADYRINELILHIGQYQAIDMLVYNTDTQQVFGLFGGEPFSADVPQYVFARLFDGHALTDTFQPNELYIIVCGVRSDVIHHSLLAAIQQYADSFVPLGDLRMNIDVLNNYDGRGDFATRIITPFFQRDNYVFINAGNADYFEAFDQIIQTGAALVNFYADGELDRIVYARLYRPFDWIVSVSINARDIQELSLGLADQFQERLNRTMLMIAVLSLLAFMVALMAFTMLGRRFSGRADSEIKMVEEESMAKSLFLARMSHEIRTPMNAILGMAELILREEISEQTREQAVIIRHSGSHLLTIINDILDLSKIESGKLELTPAEYAPASLINDLINTIKVRLPGRKLRFILNISSDIPQTLQGDAARVYQVLINLLSNAVKYTDKGFVALDMEGRRKGDTVQLLIKVRDSGKGIKEEDLAGLFQEFTRLDAEVNKNVEGTGLGLAITRSLVHHMGGTIEVASTYGVGSTFTVMLPQIIKDPEKMAKVIAPEEKPVIVFERRQHLIESIQYTMTDLGVPFTIAETHAQFCQGLKSGKYAFAFVAERLYDLFCAECLSCQTQTKIILVNQFDDERAVKDRKFPVITTPLYSLAVVSVLNNKPTERADTRKRVQHFTAPTAKVLIVDDVQVNLKVADGLLKPYQMATTLCESGQAAIEAVTQGTFDLVLMDHIMPGMSWVEATGIMREVGVSIPIIALTANAIVGAKEMFLDAGFDDFLSKPIEVALLNTMLAKWIPKEKQEQADLAAAVSDAQLDIRIEGVDTVRGLALFGGNARLYMDIITLVGRNYAKKLDNLTNHLETGDLHLYTVRVHALKAVFANIGADALSTEAQNLEDAADRQDSAFIQTHHPLFAKNMKRLIKHINEAIGDEGENNEDFDEAAMFGKLADLRAALSTFDVVAIDKIAENMQSFTRHPTHGDAISELLRLAFVSKYKQAETLANNILSEVTK